MTRSVNHCSWTNFKPKCRFWIYWTSWLCFLWATLLLHGALGMNVHHFQIIFLKLQVILSFLDRGRKQQQKVGMSFRWRYPFQQGASISPGWKKNTEGTSTNAPQQRSLPWSIRTSGRIGLNGAGPFGRIMTWNFPLKNPTNTGGIKKNNQHLTGYIAIDLWIDGCFGGQPNIRSSGFFDFRKWNVPMHKFLKHP